MKCKKIIFAVLLASLIPNSAESSWVLYHKPAFKGKVIDAETKQPIEGAVAVAVYSKESWFFSPGTVSIIINVREAPTDKDGIFKIPSYTTTIDPLSVGRDVSFIIYKPGYETFPGVNAPINQEGFFSIRYGEIGEIELWRRPVQEGNGPELYTIKVTLGVVELHKVMTKEERRQSWMDADVSAIAKFREKLPVLDKMVSDESKSWP